MSRTAAAAQAGSPLSITRCAEGEGGEALDRTRSTAFQAQPVIREEERIYVLAPDEHDEVRVICVTASDYPQIPDQRSRNRSRLSRLDVGSHAYSRKAILAVARRKSAAFQKAVVGRGKAIETLQKKYLH